MYIYIYRDMYIFIYIHIYTYTYTYMYVYVYAYIYMNISRLALHCADFTISILTFGFSKLFIPMLFSKQISLSVISNTEGPKRQIDKARVGVELEGSTMTHSYM